jgi:hypothetical protein
MRIKLVVISGAVLVLTAGTGAAYAVVGQTSVSPTVTGNVLPIDDNHSSATRPEPGDDRGRATAEPGDDRGAATAEPGDDRGRATAEPGDDRTRGRGTDDTTAGPTRSAGPTAAVPATAASPSSSDDHGRGHDGPGHH